MKLTMDELIMCVDALALTMETGFSPEKKYKEYYQEHVLLYKRMKAYWKEHKSSHVTVDTADMGLTLDEHMMCGSALYHTMDTGFSPELMYKEHYQEHLLVYKRIREYWTQVTLIDRRQYHE